MNMMMITYHLQIDIFIQEAYITLHYIDGGNSYESARSQIVPPQSTSLKFFWWKDKLSLYFNKIVEYVVRSAAYTAMVLSSS